MILRVMLASRRPHLDRDLRVAVDGEDVLLSTVAEGGALGEALRSATFDLLVIDAELLPPERDVFFAELRALPDAPETVVLLADDDPRQRADLLESGALSCLAGDLERQTLVRMVRALARRASRQAMQGILATQESPELSLRDFASGSPCMQAFLATVCKVADTRSSLLLLGETGVGKEYLARAIHRESARRSKPFVALNCAALPETLLESELFGHERGAFTGANGSRRGYFERAHGGTVFLDEIAELPAHLQVKLLRVLQERELQPVGSERTVKIDVRVIAATNQDIRRELEAGRLRADLYYRLGVVTLRVPSLRERREDIPDLVLSHLEIFGKTLARPVDAVDPEAMMLFERYSWPGNVRELINVVERAVLLAEGNAVLPRDLPEEMRASIDLATGPAGIAARSYHGAREALLESFERAYVEECLRATGGRVGEAAARSGLSPRSLYEKMKRLGLRKESFRVPAQRG